MSSFSSALPVFLLVSLSGCAGAQGSSYERCLRDPASHGDGKTRQGYTARDDSVRWMEWGGGGAPPRDPVLKLAITLQNCMYSVTAEGAQARWTHGGFTYVDTMSFHADRSGRRVGFVASDESGTYAMIDGAKSGPYQRILWRPSFSSNGRHAGFLAKTGAGDGAVAVVDGQVVARARDFHESLFELLDDGRLAAAPKRDDGMYEVVVGRVTSAPLTELCRATVRPSGHFGVSGKGAGGWVTLIDGREIPAPGRAAGCEVTFSQDDTRWGWIAIDIGPPGAKPAKAGAVIDGTFHPLSTQVADIRFVQGLAIVRTNTADPSGYGLHGARKWESVHWLVDLPTPDVPPTEDSYSPTDDGHTVEWVRVRIGDSVGPRFDRIDWGSFFVDEGGHVHYAGERGGAHVPVIDNVVIQAQPQLQVPAQLQVPVQQRTPAQPQVPVQQRAPTQLQVPAR